MLNQQELNREERITKKLLVLLDERIEELSKERLTEFDQKIDTAVSLDVLLLSLSKERRALLRTLKSSRKYPTEETEE